MNWLLSHCASDAIRPMADRHYSRQKPGSLRFVPPGRCFVLIADDGGAYWTSSWPFAEYVRHEWAGAWICSAFRNETRRYLSSDLIRQAIAATRYYWGEPPELGMVTFVDASKVKPKRDPGRCFLRAGFRPCGSTKGGLLALQLLPTDMPAAEPAGYQQVRLFA